MVTKSDFGERRSKVLFNKVEFDRLSLGDRAFELSRGVDLTEKELRSVTWVYDPETDSVVWSDSLEEFFGFEDGTWSGSESRTCLAPPLPRWRWHLRLHRPIRTGQSQPVRHRRVVPAFPTVAFLEPLRQAIQHPRRRSVTP